MSFTSPFAGVEDGTSISVDASRVSRPQRNAQCAVKRDTWTPMRHCKRANQNTYLSSEKACLTETNRGDSYNDKQATVAK